MENTGLIVANDLSLRRIKALTHNLDRIGVLNCLVTSMDGCRFGRLLPNFFHVSLVDVPCSAEGTAKRSFKVWSQWHPGIPNRLSHIQKPLLVSAYKATKPGGLIIYSTCTFAPEENENVVSHLLDHYPCTLEEVALPGLNTAPGLPSWRGTMYNQQIQSAKRIYPHKNNVGGFFVAKIRKGAE
jgi:16S rRNA C967 or C1407 C5-methylase (RsmB/RsmF family)